MGNTELILIGIRRDWNELTGRSAKQVWPSTDQITHWRANQAYATKMCIKAVDRLFESSDANAWFNSNEAQRLFRDSHMTGQCNEVFPV